MSKLYRQIGQELTNLNNGQLDSLFEQGEIDNEYDRYQGSKFLLEGLTANYLCILEAFWKGGAFYEARLFESEEFKYLFFSSYGGYWHNRQYYFRLYRVQSDTLKLVEPAWTINDSMFLKNDVPEDIREHFYSIYDLKPYRYTDGFVLTIEENPQFIDNPSPYLKKHSIILEWTGNDFKIKN